MSGRFICHKDFALLERLCVFHKEKSADFSPAPHPEHLRNRHVLFRRKFSLDSSQNPFKRARIKITADDYYKLYINGAFIGQGPAPSYPTRYYYDEYDISGYLKEGENTLAVHTYYQGLINRVWVSGDLSSFMFCELYLDDSLILESDESFLCSYHDGFSDVGKFGYDTAFAQCYDSASLCDKFYMPDFDDNGWDNASLFAGEELYTLTPSRTKHLSIYKVKPKTVKASPDGRIFIDFGREMVGYLSLKARGKKGSSLLLRFAEELSDDGEESAALAPKIRYNMRCNCKYEEKWILSGALDALNEFDYKAFRYAEIVLCNESDSFSLAICDCEHPSTEDDKSGTVQIYEISMLVRHYPYEEKNFPQGYAEPLSRILRLCADTVKYGTQECFLDCPTREKGQYLGDVAISARAQAVLTGDLTLMKKALYEFSESSFICKGLMAVANCSLMQEIADYSLIFPSLVLWVYKIERDRDFLLSFREVIDGLCAYFMRFEDSYGLLDCVNEKWNLVDWPSNLRDGYDFTLSHPIGRGRHNVINALWCGFLRDAFSFFSLIGEDNTAENLQKKLDKSKRAFISLFYSPEKGLFRDAENSEHFSVHSNIYPLLFDIGTDTGKDREGEGKNELIIDGLKDRLANYIYAKKLSSMGVYASYYALSALMLHGYEEYAISLATDEGCWLKMLREGATTTFEAWGKGDKWNTSLFHPWAVAPIIVFSKTTPIY